MDNTLKPDLQEHWNQAYTKTDIDKLGWFETDLDPSLRLIKSANLEKNASILNVGVGTSTLIDELINLDYSNLIASDLSSVALEKLKLRLGAKSKQVNWIVDDLTSPKNLNLLEPVDLWHDRAVLHFFNEEKEQNSYFELLKKLVKVDGYVIIAAFNLDGATKCSGLPVHRYNEKMLQQRLGEDFELKQYFDYLYTMPSGNTRNYVYTLFKRQK